MAEDTWTDIEEVPNFLAADNWEARIGNLAKAQLLLIAEYLGLNLTETTKKGVVLMKILDTVRASKERRSSGLLDESMLLDKQFQVQEKEVEKLKLQAQIQEQLIRDNERERAERELERAREREKEAHEIQVLQLKKGLGQDQFNISSAMKLVPQFDEKNVAEFFIAFEKIANKLKWPEVMWTTLVQSRLIGKAQKVYVALKDDLSSDYASVKEIVLKSYKLVPEAYRLKFRELKKQPGQTYVEFARMKEHLMNEWLLSKEVSTFENLKELVLIEDFKACCGRELKVHLEELKLGSLQECAISADEFMLSHRNMLTQYRWRGKKEFVNNPKGDGSKKESTNIDESRDKSPKKGKTKGSPRGSPNASPNRFRKKLTCYFCKKPGHVRAKCYAYRNYMEQQLPIGLLMSGLGTNDSSIEGYRDFMSKGQVSSNNKGIVKEVNILRDTGALQSLILRSALPSDFVERHTEYVLLGGFPNTVSSYPLETLYLDSEWFEGLVRLAVVDNLPMKGVDMIVANDIAVGDKVTYPIVNEGKMGGVASDDVVDYPVNLITRSMTRQDDQEIDLNTSEEINGNIEQSLRTSIENLDQVSWDIESLRNEQMKEFVNYDNAVSEPEEVIKPVVVWLDGLLYRFSRNVKVPAEKSEVRKQIMVPSVFRNKLLSLAHEDHLSGHFGVKKTMDKIVEHFYWPKIRKDCKRFVNTCHVCQIVGKPNQKIPKAPLFPLQVVSEPFQEVQIDIVGPLPRTKSGNVYILTIIDRMSNYPEAIPVRSIKSRKVVEELVKFFTKFGLPKVVQSDCGSNFTSKVFAESMNELGIQHVTSTPYHPESQGKIERFHQTMKSILKKYCIESGCDWDKELPYLLFAFRSAPSETLGYSPFQLIFGHCVRGPLDVVRECWENDDAQLDLLTYISELGNKLSKAWDYAKEHLISNQESMKSHYDKRVKAREFSAGERVLILLPIPGNPLCAKYYGPLKVIKKINNLNYLVETPSRRKKFQRCHVNMIKPYVNRDEVILPVMNVTEIDEKEETKPLESDFPIANSEILSNLSQYLAHLSNKEREDMTSLILEYKEIFKDDPGLTHLLKHDVEVGDNSPIKQGPYRLNPYKNELVRKEVKYMLDHNLALPSSSPWSSPVVLVKKEKGRQGQHRLCFDYRKLNEITKTDSYPLPRVDDCIDRIGTAKYISKLDLLKGYWQVGLTPRAQAASAFVTKDGLFECKVMPFGMKNASATFQRLMNMITQDIDGCIVYIDDIVIYSDDWNTHLKRLRKLFLALRKAKLIVNLRKSAFAKAKIIYLGHEIGYGKVSPRDVNIESIINFPIPKTKRDVRSFMGMCGYYRRFVENFADIAKPLTLLTKKTVSFKWSSECNQAFIKLKAILTKYPVLASPDFSKPFELSIDASDTGVGAVLHQNIKGISHPVSYYSKKFNEAQRRYSTVEKETLSLVLALNHFEIYLNSSPSPIKVFTDHNPLVFLNKFKNKNRRLMNWSVILQEWNLDIHHIPGRKNIVPDALSRV